MRSNFDQKVYTDEMLTPRFMRKLCQGHWDDGINFMVEITSYFFITEILLKPNWQKKLNVAISAALQLEAGDLANPSRL